MFAYPNKSRQGMLKKVMASEPLSASLVRSALASGEDGVLWDAFSAWLLRETRAPATMAIYRCALRVYLEFLGSLPEVPTFLNLENEFAVWMKGQRKGGTGSEARFRPETMRTYLKAVSLFQRALAGADVDRLSRKKVERSRAEAVPFTSSEILTLLVESDPLMSLIVYLVARFGLRSGEIRQLQRHDLIVTSSTPLLRVSALDTQRQDLEISEDLVDSLNAAFSQSQNGFLFAWTSVALEQRFKRLCDKAGVKHKPLSALRLYCGAQRVFLGDLAEFFGLRSRSSFKVYREAANYLKIMDEQSSQDTLSQYILPTTPRLLPPTQPSPRTHHHRHQPKPGQ